LRNKIIPILQNVILGKHLKKIESDIEKAIPNENFNGLAIIDYEKWRPLYEHNWSSKRIYRKESIAYVKKRNSRIDEKTAESIAKDEFNNASMEFLIQTIRKAKTMRPKAFWGYYGMPFCNYTAGTNGTIACGEVYENFNDRLLSLYIESTALYPSIYLPNRESNVTGCLYVISVLQEAKRCAAKLMSKVPIYTFTAIEYFPLKPDDPYYTRVN
uniref:Hyaluronidase n=1 Tax=Elaeophora elaphi TaxID=1147741 RepID=A0A0R3RNW5_9BILA